jgi:hypothetical protein
LQCSQRAVEFGNDFPSILLAIQRYCMLEMNQALGEDGPHIY